MKKTMQVMMQCPLFTSIEEKDLTAMLACLQARQQHFDKGAVILAEGSSATCLGIVLSGAAQVIREDYYGNRSILTKLEASDLFAETFACAGVQTMPVSVIAADATNVIFIKADRIAHPCSSSCGFHHQLIFNLMKTLAIKNLLCNQKLEITAKRTTREKLMTYLMMQTKKAGSNNFIIPYSRQELADYLEVDRSGLSAEISKLRREGILQCERNQFTLLIN